MSFDRPCCLTPSRPSAASAKAALKRISQGRLLSAERDERAATSTLQSLRDAAGAPIIAFPPLGHSALFFRPLLDYVEPQIPILSIVPEAVLADDSLASFSERIADELITRFPAGPYRLLGVCRGSHFAHAVGQRLRAAGHRVVLVVVDSESPHMGSSGFLAKKAPVLLFRGAHVLRLIAHHRLDYIPGRIRLAWHEWRDPAVGARLQLQRHLFRLTELFRAEPSDVRVICIESEEARDSKTYESHRGWQRLAGEQFESLVFPGTDHQSMTAAQTPYLPNIAKALSEAFSNR